MATSLKTPVNPTVNQQPAQTQKPTMKTPVVSRRKACRETEIGAIWIKEPQKGGEEYMTGEVEVNGVKVSFVGFINHYKDMPNKPDWRLHSRDLLDVPASLSSNQSTSGKLSETNTQTQSEEVEQNPAFLS